jgi:hypothetical protein
MVRHEFKNPFKPTQEREKKKKKKTDLERASPDHILNLEVIVALCHGSVSHLKSQTKGSKNQK